MKSRVEGFLRLGAGGVLLTVPIMASALKFDVGEVQGSFDTTLSAGMSVRVQDADTRLIGIANGGRSRSVNEDDGNLNYDEFDIVSATIKATHDISLQRGDSGLFTRFTYFYDGKADRDRSNFGKRGDDRLVSEVDLLDLFAYTTFQVGGRNMSVRVGNQVVNWGESTFIGGGINSINPVDVTKLRIPGSEIKEALLPVPILWTSYSITDAIGIEALWIADFKETEIDPRGSFFSTNDFISDDGDRAYTGFGRGNDQHVAPPAPSVARSADRRPDNEADQYGVALRYFAEALNGTEFGLYYLKYHNRTPIFSGVRGTGAFPATLATASYFADYVDGVELYGLSFNTDGPFGVAIQGEYSYRPNQPLQLGGIELLLAALRAPNRIDTIEGTDPTTAPANANGYRSVKQHQAQTTLTKAFGPTFGANQFTLIGEVGATRLELADNVPFNGPGVSLAFAAQPGQNGYANRFSWGYRLVSRLDFENAIGPASLSPRLVFAHDVAGVSPTFNKQSKAVTAGLGMNYLQRWQADLAYTAFFGGRTYRGTDAAAPAGQPLTFATSANPNRDRDFVALSVSYAF